MAFKCDDLEAFADRAQALGVETEGPFSLSRKGEDGSGIDFEALTLKHPKHRLPVLLDWKDVPHPSQLLGEGVKISEIGLLTPDPDDLTALLQKLGIALEVRQADRAAFFVRIDGPAGTVEG